MHVLEKFSCKQKVCEKACFQMTLSLIELLNQFAGWVTFLLNVTVHENFGGNRASIYCNVGEMTTRLSEILCEATQIFKMCV